MIVSFTPSHRSGNNFHFSCTNITNSSSHFQPTSNLMHYGPGSIADQTLSAYKGNTNQSSTQDKILVKKEDNFFYLRNPDNDYVSQYPVSFRGCLGCGDTLHLLRACLRRNDSSVRKLFWEDTHAHVPATRTENHAQVARRASPSVPQYHYSAVTGSVMDKNSSGLGHGKKLNYSA